MLGILAIVFLGVFAVAALLMVAAQSRHAQPETPGSVQKKQRTLSPPDVRKVVLFSAIPWLNKYLQNMELAPRLRLLIYQGDLKWTVGQMLLMSASAAVFPGYLLYLTTRSSTLPWATGAVTGFIPVAVLLFRRKQRFNKFEEELPNALELMVSALRAGHSFNAALGLAAHEASEPVRSEFRICFDEQNFGLDLRHALDNLVTRMPLTDLRIAVTAVLIQKETGGNLAELLNNTSEVIRERDRLKRQVRVHTAHGRMTGWVIGLLPLALLVVLYFLNPGMESLLWKRAIGVKLLYVGGGMMIVGGLLIRKIVRMDV